LSLLFLTLIKRYFTRISVNKLVKVEMSVVGFEVGIVFKPSIRLGFPKPNNVDWIAKTNLHWKWLSPSLFLTSKRDWLSYFA